MGIDRRLTIRFVGDEYERVAAQAERHGMRVSTYLRQKAVEEERVFRDPEVVQLLKDIHFELRRLNVRTAATGEASVRDVLREVYGLLRRVEDVLLMRGGGRHGNHKAAAD